MEKETKLYYTQDLYSGQANGKRSKYSVNFYDGIQKHPDGSQFYGIKLFKNQKDLNNFIYELVQQGYRERNYTDR